MIKIDEELLALTKEKAARAPRLRMNYNFHKVAEDPFQRLLNAVEPPSYIQPHKHEAPDKREVFVILTGRIVVFEFDDHGSITDHIILDRNTGNFGAEIDARRWHTIVSLEPGSVLIEMKDGPYDPADDKNFALGAPAEGDPGTTEYNTNLLARIGIPRS